jgi:hypothetical protein
MSYVVAGKFLTLNPNVMSMPMPKAQVCVTDLPNFEYQNLKVERSNPRNQNLKVERSNPRNIPIISIEKSDRSLGEADKSRDSKYCPQRNNSDTNILSVKPVDINNA